MKGPANQFLEYFTPYYQLDQYYNFQDWNYAFQYLFADWVELEFGDSATKFVDVFENVADVKSRNLTTFFIGNVPVIDREPIHIDHKAYGMMTIQKFATQNFDSNGKFQYWTLSYNIDKCDKIDEIHDRMIQWFEYDTLYTRFVNCLSKIAPHNKTFSTAVRDHFAAGALCIGGFGAEDLYKAAAKAGITDSLENRRVTQHWNEQYFGDHGNRTCIERLTGYQKDSCDLVIAPLLCWTAEDLKRCAQDIDRVLKKDGKAYVFDLETMLAPANFAGADGSILESYTECYEYLSQKCPRSEYSAHLKSFESITIV